MDLKNVSVYEGMTGQHRMANEDSVEYLWYGIGHCEVTDRESVEY